MAVWGAAEASGKCANEGGRKFLGVGRLHPLVSLQFEMNMLPVKWEAMKRSMEFWVQVIIMANGRLLEIVMIEGVWVEGAGCGAPEWVDDEGSEAGFEGYSMEEGERGLKRGS